MVGRVVERGVLTAPAQTWDAAARRAGVIRQLADHITVGVDAADVAAAELGISRRQVYALVKLWRAGEGVVSDLLPGRLGSPVPVVAVASVGFPTRARRLCARSCRRRVFDLLCKRVT